MDTRELHTRRGTWGMGMRDEEHGGMLWMYVIICKLYVYSTSYPVRLV